VLAAIVFAGISIAIVFASFPIRIGAFWPFATTRAADDLPSLHDAEMALLDAATNPDPNPSKGGVSITTTDGSLMPAGGPVGDLSTASFGGTSEVTEYEVREGDSVSEIADMFGVSVATILSANDIKDASTIQPGDTLRILPVSGVVYTIKRGGTLSDVAALFDVEVDAIAEINGIDKAASLAAGTELIVPGGTSLPAKKSSPKSSTSSGVAVAKKVLPSLNGYFGNPVPSAYVSQGIHGKNGIDLAGIPSGTPVYAAAAGIVTTADGDGLYNGGYGNYVDVTHDNGTVTRYAHLSSVAVSVGQAVAKGDHLGGVGNTGRSTGNHLHFEVHGAQNPFAH
jgi:murein DD-endopeptidase MepM/ murein hydrolase activator NlpD